MKCCITLSFQVFLNQIHEFSTWLYIKISAVYLIIVNWGRADGDNEDEVFEILRKLLDLYRVKQKEWGSFLCTHPVVSPNLDWL